MHQTMVSLLNKAFNDYSDNVAIICSDNTKLLYSQVKERAARVATYLSKMGVKDGSLVAILMERSTDYVIVSVACMLFGYGFIPLGTEYPKERIDLIIDEVNPSFVITETDFAESQKEAPQKTVNYDISPSNPAYVVFTSGSTKKPKGIVHDQLSLTSSVEKYRDAFKLTKDDIWGASALFTFVVMILEVPTAFASGSALTIIPRDIVKDPVLLSSFIAEKGITGTFISPRVLKFFKKTGNTLKLVFTGTERVCDVKPDNFRLISTYGQSESCGPCVFQEIEKPYEAVPIGKPLGNVALYLLDEKDNEAGEGEICLTGHFMTGYLNNKEQTEKVLKNNPFINKDGNKYILHTGDIGKRLPNGDVLFINRKDWMIKINGQRVEPGEIEYSMKSIVGVKDSVVKGFTRSDGSVYLCAYYILDNEISVNQIRNKLQSRLVYYMIPSFFVKLEDFPTLPNGKVDRNALLPPNTNQFLCEYVSPENEQQKKICQAMEHVLQIEKIGILDDFFALGGSSIQCMYLSSYLRDKMNINCQVRQIYNNPIPKMLDKAIKANIDTEKLESEINRDQYTLPYQRYHIDYQLYSPKLCISNNVMFLKMNRKIVNPYRFCEIVNKAIHHYANLGSVFTFDDQSDLVFRYRPELIKDITVTETSEEQIERVFKPGYCKPFGILNCLLYRMNIYGTEEHTWLFMDFHHSIFDGATQKALLKAIFDYYNGIDFPDDRYYEYLKRIHNEEISDCGKTLKLLRDKYGYFEDYDTFPLPDCESSENTYGELFLDSGYTNGEIEEYAKKKSISVNCALTAAGLLGISRYNKTQRTAVEWVFNGRDESWKENLVGLVISAMPICVNFDCINNTDDLLQEVHKKISQEMKYADYSYAVRYISPFKKENMKIVYEYNVGLPDNVPEGTQLEYDFSRLTGSMCIFQCIVEPGKKEDHFILNVTCNASMYSRNSMLKIGNIIIEALEDCLGITHKTATITGSNYLLEKP